MKALVDLESVSPIPVTAFLNQPIRYVLLMRKEGRMGGLTLLLDRDFW